MTVLQIAEPDPRVVEFIGAERARVAEHQLVHVSIGVAAHIRDRERVVAVLVRDAVTERPRRLPLREVESVGELIGIRLPRFVVHEVRADDLL